MKKKNVHEYENDERNSERFQKWNHQEERGNRFNPP